MADRIYEFLENKPSFCDDIPRELKCQLCHSLMIHPTFLPCGCEYCYKCLQCYLENGKQFCIGSGRLCKSDKMGLSDICRNPATNKRIMKLFVRCVYNECDKQLIVEDMVQHIVDCEWGRQDCPLMIYGCINDKMEEDKLNIHMMEYQTKHVTNIVSKMEEMKSDNLLMRDQITGLTNENNEFKLTTEELKGNISTMTLDKNKLGKKIEELGKQLDKLNKEVKNICNEKMEGIESKVAYLQICTINMIDNQSTVNITTEMLKDKHSTLKQSVKQIQSDEISMKNNLKDLQKISLSQSKNIENITEHKDELKRKTVELQDTIKKLRIEIKQTRDNHLKEMKIVNATQSENMNKLTNENETLKMANQEIQNDVEKLKLVKVEMEMKIDIVMEMMTKIEEDGNKTRSEKKLLETNLINLNDFINKNLGDIKNCQRDLEIKIGEWEKSRLSCQQNSTVFQNRNPNHSVNVMDLIEEMKVKNIRYTDVVQNNLINADIKLGNQSDLSITAGKDNNLMSNLPNYSNITSDNSEAESVESYRCKSDNDDDNMSQSSTELKESELPYSWLASNLENKLKKFKILWSPSFYIDGGTKIHLGLEREVGTQNVFLIIRLVKDHEPVFQTLVISLVNQITNKPYTSKCVTINETGYDKSNFCYPKLVLNKVNVARNRNILLKCYHSD